MGMEAETAIVDVPAESPVEGTIKVKGFQKGADPRRYDPKTAGKGIKKVREPKTVYVGPSDASAPEELILSWHVLQNDKEHDKTAAQRNMRIGFEATPLMFRKHVREMEGEWKKAKDVKEGKVEPEGRVVVEADLGEERCVSMIEGLVKKYKEKGDVGNNQE